MPDIHLPVTVRVPSKTDKEAYSGRKFPLMGEVFPVPDLVSTILAKALVMLIEALVSRLIMQFMRSGPARDLRPAGAVA